MIRYVSKRYTILNAPEYDKWLSEQPLKDQLQIEARLLNIELNGYFGDHKFLQDDIWELKWTGGRRVYYCYLKEIRILLLLGGNKNGQSKDIIKARKISKKYTTKT